LRPPQTDSLASDASPARASCGACGGMLTGIFDLRQPPGSILSGRCDEPGTTRLTPE